VSDRVAVLSTKMQQDFYNEIAERYTDYEQYLRQVGEYDLEVEAMNLDTETLSSKVVKMGKGSASTFGDDSVLETVQANVLKKPFTKVELNNLLTESLKDKDALVLQEELIAEYNQNSQQRVLEEHQEIDTKYDELTRNIPLEKKIMKLAEKERTEAIQEREAELVIARESQLKVITVKANNRRQYLEKIFKFFFIGRNLYYPIESFTSGNEMIPSVFIGYSIDKKKKNPYAPSLIKLRFAIANSSKYLSIPASYSDVVMSVIGSSSDMSQPPLETLLENWERYTKNNNVDRKVRHIITGNLLQAFSDFKGKLVSYTTLDGKTVKGILMPENWNPGEQIQDKVVIPIIKALPLIKSLVQNNFILTNTGISFFRQGRHYRIIVAGSRSKGGDIYLDKEILALVEQNNFEKVSDKMVAMIEDSRISQLVEILQKNHSCSVTINSAQMRGIEQNSIRYNNRKRIELPPPDIEKPDNTVFLLELEAEALTLELELLAA